MKTLIIKILYVLTRLTLIHFKPVIVGITGSVGKTSTKEAVATVLRKRFSVRSSSGNYNNEFGLPLSVLGEDSPGKNLLLWVWIFIKATFKLLFGGYSQVLVLEMGADRPGDIAYLLKLTGPLDYAVITDIGISHMMNYTSTDALAKEKLTLAKGVKANGTAVLNLDNPAIVKYLNDKKPTNVLTFGLDQEADVAASDLALVKRDDTYGLNFKMKYAGTVVPALIPEALGRANVYAALAAAAVGVKMGMNLVEVSEAIGTFQPPAGRLRLIPGIKRTQIIDDTYNAAPSSTNLALDVLTQVATGRKVAAIGGMAELGSQNEQGHRDIAVKIVEVGVDLLFLVGENSKFTKDELEKRNFAGQIKWFENSDNARIPVQNELREGDTILVKGSQSARMEKIVKEIMADPEQAEKLLVRQSAYWSTV